MSNSITKQVQRFRLICQCLEKSRDIPNAQYAATSARFTRDSKEQTGMFLFLARDGQVGLCACLQEDWPNSREAVEFAAEKLDIPNSRLFAYRLHGHVWVEVFIKKANQRGRRLAKGMAELAGFSTN